MSNELIFYRTPDGVGNVLFLELTNPESTRSDPPQA